MAHAANAHVRRFVRFVGAWPRLSIAIAITAGAFLVVTMVAPWWPFATRFLIAWDAGVIFFIVALNLMIIGADTEQIRWRAARQDVGKFAILFLNAAAAGASLAAIYAELGFLGTGPTAGLRLALSGFTILLSWVFIHLIFAVHYAHEYYDPEAGRSGGLLFPGDLKEPDYWDFVYFSLVIGMTSQVSDIAVTSRSIRRTVTGHGVFAFFFNVALLALVVNLAADAIK